MRKLLVGARRLMDGPRIGILSRLDAASVQCKRCSENTPKNRRPLQACSLTVFCSSYQATKTKPDHGGAASSRASRYLAADTWPTWVRDDPLNSPPPSCAIPNPPSLTACSAADTFPGSILVCGAAIAASVLLLLRSERKRAAVGRRSVSPAYAACKTWLHDKRLTRLAGKSKHSSWATYWSRYAKSFRSGGSR